MTSGGTSGPRLNDELAVDPGRIEGLAAVFAQLNLTYSIELWSADRSELLRELDGRSTP